LRPNPNSADPRVSVKPLHYNLELTNLDLEAFTYDGVVAISLELKEKTNSISLNFKELTLHGGFFAIEGSDKSKQIRVFGAKGYS
jgi:hypothetical protein